MFFHHQKWRSNGSSKQEEVHRKNQTEVTKGESEDEEEEEELEEVGGGMGTVETSCMDWESTTEIELPAAKAMRPEELKSADPKLLRLGGPGNMQSQKSWGSGGCAAADDGDAVIVVGLKFAIGDPDMEALKCQKVF